MVVYCRWLASWWLVITVATDCTIGNSYVIRNSLLVFPDRSPDYMYTYKLASRVPKNISMEDSSSAERRHSTRNTLGGVEQHVAARKFVGPADLIIVA